LKDIRSIVTLLEAKRVTALPLKIRKMR